MSKSSDRRMSLLEEFKVNNVLSLETIMEKFQVSKRTVQGDVEAINGMGYSISVARSGEHKGLYVMKDEEPDSASLCYDAMRGIAGDAVILMKLQDKNGRKLELSHDELYRRIRGEEADVNNNKYYGDRFTWYTNAISRLKTAKCIRERITLRDGKKQRLYQLDINAPRFVKLLSDEYDDGNMADFFTEAVERLSDYNSEQDSKTNRILSKLQLHMDGAVEDQESYYIKRERWSDEELAIDQIKKLLIRYPYTTKALKLTYLGGDGKTYVSSVKVGMLVFAVGTNNLYLLGENIEDNNIINILVPRITHIEELDIKNDIYNSKRYLNSLKYMFGAAGVGDMSETVEVEAKFELIGNVANKLEKLVETRNKYGASAQLIYDGKTVIYKDRMFNISDVKAFLRGFGSSCTVIKPIELRDDMINSAQRVLEQYKKEGYEV